MAIQTEETAKTAVVLHDCDILNPTVGMDDKIELASSIATKLSSILKKQNLTVKISGKEYVLVEGWNTLGTILGCTPYVESVQEISLGEKNYQYGYEATVSIRQGDTIISRASAIAERNNSQKERHAVYSMAQTRATGKAFRLALSWLLNLAGYATTPAEEMPQFKDIKKE